MRLGIDYGTSHTVAVLAWPDGRRRPLHFGASTLFPSAVHAGHGGILRTGHDALRGGLGEPAGLEPNPKRRIDDGDVLLGDTAYPVADLIAATLRTVWGEAVRVAGKQPDEVTLTHPAEWGPVRRRSLAEAAEKAGIPAPAYLSEPVAAATFFVTEAAVEVPVGSHAVVYDLGAGTFDVSLVRRTAEGFDVLSSGGLGDVGGLDLDGVVVDRVGTVLSRGEPAVWRRLTDPADPAELRARHALWTEARNAKETLSRQSSASLFVPLLDRDTLVSREEFERDATPILDRTAATMMTVVARAGVEWPQVAAVFLVGGSSRVPLAATLVHRACGIAPTVVEQPELVVAEGGVLARRPEPAPRPEPAALPPELARLVDAAMEAVAPSDVPDLLGPRIALLDFLAAADPDRALRIANTLDVDDAAVRDALDDLESTSPAHGPDFTALLPDGSPLKPLLLVETACIAAPADPARARRLLLDAIHAAETVQDGPGKAWILAELAATLLMAADPGLVARATALAVGPPVDVTGYTDLLDALRSQGAADPREGMRLLGEAERIVRALPESETTGDQSLLVVIVLSLADPARGEELARSFAPVDALMTSATVMDSADPARWEELGRSLDSLNALGMLVASAVAMGGTDPARAGRMLTDVEEAFTAVFTAVGEDSLSPEMLNILAPAWAAVDPARVEGLLERFPDGAGAARFETVRETMTWLVKTDPDRAQHIALALSLGEGYDRDAVTADLVCALASRDPGRAEALVVLGIDGEHRVRAVGALATSLVASDIDRAERLAGLVIPEDAPSRVAIAAAIVDVDHARAERILLSIEPDPERRWDDVEEVVAKLAAADPEAAERVALHIPADDRAASAVHAAVALAPKHPDRAERLLGTVFAAHAPVTALVAVAHGFTAKGGGFMSSARRRGQRLFEEAERVAHGGGDSRAGMLAEVAVALAEFDGAHARHLLDEAEAAWAEGSADLRGSSVGALVKAWTVLGDTGRAERLAVSIPDTHPRERAEALLTIVQSLRPF